MNDAKTPHLSISIVSHGQAHLIKDLLQDLSKIYDGSFEVILTENIPEINVNYSEFIFIKKIIKNDKAKGFGSNHNNSFKHSRGRVFIVMNPDIRILEFSFKPILDCLEQDGVGACAPVILSNSGTVEDSARKYPSFLTLFRRTVLRERSPDYKYGNSPFSVDWVAGMFIAFKRDVYKEMTGFDERYFMYCEDVDICKRIYKKGLKVMLQPATSVVHNAQRASHRSLKHLRWHFRSMFRFLFGF